MLLGLAKSIGGQLSVVIGVYVLRMTVRFKLGYRLVVKSNSEVVSAGEGEERAEIRPLGGMQS